MYVQICFAKIKIKHKRTTMLNDKISSSLDTPTSESKKNKNIFCVTKKIYTTYDVTTKVRKNKKWNWVEF